MSAGSKTQKSAQAHHRQRRLAAELKANLGKRKAQTRARTAAGETATVAPKHRTPERPSGT
jgi:hypothetical protein